MWGTRLSRAGALLLGANVLLPLVAAAARFRWPFVAAALTAHAVFFYALMEPLCAWLQPMVTRFEPAGKEAWLTIDDGPDGPRSEALAEALRQRGVRATFFVRGDRLAAWPETAQAVLAAGHTLANHTATHPVASFCLLPPSRLAAEIDGCHQALGAAGVTDRRWFRGPLGTKHLLLRAELEMRGLRYLCWSLRAHDGVLCRPERVARRVARLARPGCIILLHEARRHSNEAILRSVDALLAEGYRFVIPAEEQLR